MRLLHVEHPDGGGPGVFADVAPLRTWRAWATPPPDDELDAIVLYGGATNVVDAEREPWLLDELAWLRERLADGVPVLGLCLGGQLLSHALGGEVTRARPPEIGWCDVALTDAGRADPVTGVLDERDGTFTACQWHSWRFTVPAGGTLLATSSVGPQAFRCGASIGVQFHPEVDRPTLTRWVEHFDEDPDAVAMGFDVERELEELDRHLDRWNALGRRLFDRFLADATGD